MSRARDGRLGSLVGGILITQGVLVAILRLLSIVYVIASEAYNADRFRTPPSHLLPWVLVTIVVTFVLVWAGSFLRREPSGAWAQVGRDARIVLVAAGLLNVAALATAVAGLARTPATVEGALTWVAIAVTAAVVLVGLIRDVRRSRATAEPGTAA